MDFGLVLQTDPPAYVGDDLDHTREQCRWFGGMVGNHVADLVARYGEHSGLVSEALTAYIAGRSGYDYSHHGRTGNPDTALVPDEIVDQLALYNMHDAREATIDAYGGPRSSRR